MKDIVHLLYACVCVCIKLNLSDANKKKDSGPDGGGKSPASLSLDEKATRFLLGERVQPFSI